MGKDYLYYASSEAVRRLKGKRLIVVEKDTTKQGHHKIFTSINQNDTLS